MEEAEITPILAVNQTISKIYNVGNAKRLTYLRYIAFFKTFINQNDMLCLIHIQFLRISAVV